MHRETIECLYLFLANVKHDSKPDIKKKKKKPDFYHHYNSVLIWSKIKSLCKQYKNCTALEQQSR